MAQKTGITGSGSCRAKGQVFSIDAMLSLLPMMLIVGAALQYTYLAGEQSQIMAQDSLLESKMQLLAGSVMAQYVGEGAPLNCANLTGYVTAAVGNLNDPKSLLGVGYIYDVRIGSNKCVLPGPRSDTEYPLSRLENLENPAASGSRMMLFSEEGLTPKIVEVHFTVWKNI